MQELRIEKVALEVHQGLQFMYRSRSDNNGDWHCNLGRLSGGERTLVSLALILAVRLNLCARKKCARLHAIHKTACTGTDWHDCAQPVDLACIRNELLASVQQDFNSGTMT